MATDLAEVKEVAGFNIFDVSIDRVTIMGNVPKERVNELQLLISETSAFDLWGIASTAQGLIFNKVFFSYDDMKAKAMSIRNFRMEFNPNSINDLEKKWLLENILPLLDDKGLSRLDIAFDCDFDLSKYTYIQESPTKRTEIKSRSGDLETLYLGTRTSEQMIRIYNKSVEIKEKKR
ncbi:TPA: hypothetical protein PSL13_002842, partial [Staphylococcus aureus]|nr:hypothetical protein [Staphylococcus aureus]